MVTIDLSELTIRQANELIRGYGSSGDDVEIVNPDARHYIGVGLTAPMDHDWSQIYLYIAGKTYARHNGNQVPNDIQVESLML